MRRLKKFIIKAYSCKKKVLTIKSTTTRSDSTGSTANVVLYGRFTYDLQFLYFLFIPRNFCSTLASTTKNVVFGVLTLDPLIFTNIPYRLAPNIWRHTTGHCACWRTINSLDQSLHYLQIRHNSFHKKRLSLWMRRLRNRLPIVSLWASLHHLIISDSCKEGVTGEECDCECGTAGTAVKLEV